MSKGKRSASSTKSCQVNSKKLKIVQRKSKPSVDENGFMVCRTGHTIMDRYNIEAVLGQGTYGRVVRVKDMDTLKSKAIKIFRNDESYLESAYCEIDTLQLIAENDSNETSRCIKILDYFDYHNHICIVFDAFGMSVFDYMKNNNFKPYPLKDVRHIGYQLCHAVKFLHSNGITHTDIKPENILFVDSSTFGDSENNPDRRLKSTEIRLIDFGGATMEGYKHSSIITTRYYRAPEVVLKLGWTEACDIWSIACTLFVLCFAKMLFPSKDVDIQHLRMMEEVLGPVPLSMASRSKQGFFIDGKLNCEQKLDDKFMSVCEKVKEWISQSEDDDLGFLMKRMLAYDPTERITVEGALKHRFFENMPPIDQK